ncbi:hypothetical protein [Tropicimonas sp. IMCC6043]|uniref:hypothetical protein n=1 Tax=Tropicimonas sp. IMCC6043 TaxID=2510645 RepID=UPI00101BA278|nr:hypothetical protein [Tropicimonas sp. IMCC6043]RYH08679.1 hypothetical protein EU800_15635 [Tropicimonas sp. IMCC6043]
MTDETAKNAQPASPQFDYSSGAAELRGEVYRPPEYLEYLEKATSALRAVRLIVYAGMTSFVILAIYGFILVYRLTTDVHAVVGQAEKMTQQMQAMTRSMANLNQSVTHMSGDVETMSGATAHMTGDMTAMTGSVLEMRGAVVRMSADVTRISEAVTLMQHSARNIDQSVGPLMGAANSFMPFGWPGGYAGPPPYAR